MRQPQVGSSAVARGFTLVELLLVMGIIVMLVGLLFPAVNAAVTAVRIAATQATINNLSAGLESFKQDWGIYPPSASGKDIWTGSSRSSGDASGFWALIYYLAGPDGKGWGSLDTYGRSPFSGSLSSATGAYGPYYKSSSTSAAGSPDPVQDAFKPAKVIFYYRYEPVDTNAYDAARDKGNNGTGSSDGTSSNGINISGTNFYNQAVFELLVRPKDAITGLPRWVRQDYLLISAGADRIWGYVKESYQNSQWVPTQNVDDNDISRGDAVCDDICNFRR
jgi:prepilin-type N-terminal cleavage/methylation domain-containing protein